jgi:hypothetical protein
MVGWVVPLSAPPRLAEIARFEPRHIPARRVRDHAERGELDTGRFLVLARIGRADGAQFEVGDWWFEVAAGAPGAGAIATGKSVWLVIGDPTHVPGDGGKPRVVVQVHAVLNELFP